MLGRAAALLGISLLIVGAIAVYQQGDYSVDVGRFFAFEQDPGEEDPPSAESTDEPSTDPCAVTVTDEGCADGDCDDDGALNPDASNANPISACNDQDDGNSCVGASQTGNSCDGATETPEPTDDPAEEPTPTPTPNNSCVVATDDDMCADGDCDGDGALNPAASNANPINACNDADDGNRCVGATRTTNCGSQTSTPTPVTTPTPSNSCAVVTDDDMCADGDCDGDGVLNPAASNANPIATCNDANDSDRCVGATRTTNCGPQTSTPTPLGTPTPTPTSSSCVVNVDDAMCADGDCDGDGVLNPAASNANPITACNDANDSDRCVGATRTTNCGPQASTPTPTQIAQATPTPVLNPTPTPTPVGGLSCGALGGDLCSEATTCPAGYSSVGQSSDCASCCDRVVVATPTPNPSQCIPSELTCDDGDCDDDGFNNPGIGGNDCDDGNRCILACTIAAGNTPTPIPSATPIPDSHLECRSSTCARVSGAGGDGCSSEGSSCGAPPPPSLIAEIRSKFGVSVPSTYTEGQYAFILDRLGVMGKGNLHTMIDSNSRCGGAGACMTTDGVMSFPRMGGLDNGWEGLFVHELVHAITMANSGLAAHGRNFCSRLTSPDRTLHMIYGEQGGRDYLSSVCSNDRDRSPDLHVIARMAAMLQHDEGRAREWAKLARSQGNSVPADLFAAIADIMKRPQARIESSSFFANIVSNLRGGLGIITMGVLGADAPLTGPSDAGLGDDSQPVSSGPSVSISTPGDGAVVTSESVVVGGSAIPNIESKSPVVGVRITLNGVVLQTVAVVPSTAGCTTDVGCFSWQAVVPLRAGANQLSLASLDQAGTATQIPRTIIINRTALAEVAPTASPAPRSVVAGVAARVQTGPGESTILAILLAIIGVFGYVGYMATDRYRKGEIEDISDASHHDSGNFVGK